MDDITSSVIQVIPPLLVWSTGLILSVKMIRRGGSIPEKLFVAGCSLIVIKTIISPLPRILLDTMMNQDNSSYLAVGQMMTRLSIPGAVISLAGFTCLVLAFWKKFRIQKAKNA